MERLTEKHYLGTDHYMKCSGNCNVDMDCIDCPSFDCLVERLAAYEDTWLEPEEITAMQQTLDEYHKVADPLLRAQADGRLVVLPFTRGRTLLCEENIDSPRLMKDVAPVSYTHLDVYKRQDDGGGKQITHDVLVEYRLQRL